MEDKGTDSRPGDDTLTAYDIAIEEVQVASFKLARALLARALKSGDATTTEKECADAHSVYEKMIHVYSRVPLDDAQRASLIKELGLLRSTLEECETRKAGPNRPVVSSHPPPSTQTRLDQRARIEATEIEHTLEMRTPPSALKKPKEARKA